MKKSITILLVAFIILASSLVSASALEELGEGIYRVDSDGYIVTVKTISVTYKNVYYGDESIGEINLYGLVAPDGTVIFDTVVESGTGINMKEPFVFVNDRTIIQTGSTEYITYQDNPRYGFHGNGKFGIVNRSGPYVSASDFDNIDYRGGGRYLGLRGEQYYVIGMDGLETLATPEANFLMSSWAKAEVDEAIVEELVPELLKGYYTYNITRQEFCMLAVTLYEKLNGEVELADTCSGFTDTTDVNVLKAASIGVVKGYDDGSFRPYRSITREEAATMLGRLYTLFAELPKYTGEAYADEGSISSWAKEYVDGIRETNIMHGADVKETHVFRRQFIPKAGYTIEQAIATMLRLYKSITLES